MRSILNIIIMAFVVGTVFYQVKAHNLPSVTNYINDAKSQIANLTHGLSPSFSLDTLINAPLSSIENLITPSGSNGVIPNTPAADIAKIVVPAPITKIIPVQTTTSVNTTTNKGSLTIVGIITNTNKERQKTGALTLVESSKLDASAKVKANDILARQYFEHIAPDGKTVTDLVGEQGYTYIKIGENLALGNFTSDTDVVTAWMNSPGHKANILDTQFTEIGVGVAYGMYQGHNVYIAVQHFGRPRSSCPTIDSSLKIEVENGQKEISDLSDSLIALKKTIDEGSAAGQDMSTTIILYNNGVDKYQSEFSRIDALRTKYNAQVTAFNKCIAS